MTNDERKTRHMMSAAIAAQMADDARTSTDPKQRRAAKYYERQVVAAVQSAAEVDTLFPNGKLSIDAVIAAFNS